MGNNSTMHLNKGGDSRIKQGGAPEVRGDRGAEDVEDVVGRDSGLLSESDEFERMLQDEFSQTALPSPPMLPGYHLVWLTTTSQYDNIGKRQRLGYTPVRQSELPGFDPSNGQTLEGYDSLVHCNEMVLFKIPEQKYQQIMGFFHHKKPMEEEEGVVSRFNSQGERLKDADDGVTAIERELAEKRKMPTFA